MTSYPRKIVKSRHLTHCILDIQRLTYRSPSDSTTLVPPKMEQVLISNKSTLSSKPTVAARTKDSDLYVTSLESRQITLGKKPPTAASRTPQSPTCTNPRTHIPLESDGEDKGGFITKQEIIMMRRVMYS
jgi:hypothetical protein